MSAANSKSKKSGRSTKKAPSAQSAQATSQRGGRTTRWTDEQVRLLMDTVRRSSTAKEAFEAVARQLGKSTGTVQQKYYNLQRKAGGGGSGSRRGRRPAAGGGTSTASAGAGRRSGAASEGDLRALSVDDLVNLASRVKTEVDRRRKELDAASALFG